MNPNPICGRVPRHRPVRLQARLLARLLAVILLLSLLLPNPAGAYFPDGPESATLVLGQPGFTSSMPGSGPAGLNFPNGAAVDPISGKVFVADYQNHRVLRYAGQAALVNGAAAEAVLGQPNLATYNSATTQAGMGAPGGVFVDRNGRLWVADTPNNRILRYNAAAYKASGANADGVLGQADFTSALAATSQNGLAAPRGMALDSAGRLWVADTGNSRVLRFDNAAGLSNGAPANQVLGQAGFDAFTIATGANRLLAPNGLAVDAAGRLWVADTAHHRVLRFDNAAGLGNGANAAVVLGQADFTSITSGTAANRFNQPTSVALDGSGRLFVADLGNNRITYFNTAAGKLSGANADGVLGQPNLVSGAANAFGLTARSLANPRGLFYDPGMDGLWVADALNMRVLVFGGSQLVVQGNGYTIPRADSSPEAQDLSHFGAIDVGHAVVHTFTLRNTGLLPVNLETNAQGRGVVEISGTDAADFSVFSPPASGSLAPGTSLTFSVRFIPKAIGPRRAHIFIPHSDDEHLGFDFDIQGEGGPYYLTSFHAADRVLGQPDFVSHTSGQAASRVWVPNDLAVDPTSGKVFVADTGNNRVLRFARVQDLGSGAAAEAVLGQANFTANALALTQTGMNNPRGIFVDAGGRLWVSDFANHRVLRFDQAASLGSGAPANGVFGQPDFTTAIPAGGGRGMKQPVEVLVDDGGRLWVSDMGNHRVLRFDAAASLPNYPSISTLLGQANYSGTDPGVGPDRLHMPGGLAMDQAGGLWVADAGNHRVLRFVNAAHLTSGAEAGLVLGQADFTSSAYGTSASRMHMPLGLALDAAGRLWVADTANHRIMRFNHPAGQANGVDADGGLGQLEPTTEEQNLGGVSAQSLNYPGSVVYDPVQDVLWVVDSINNRLLAHLDALMRVQGGAEVGGTAITIGNQDTSPSLLDGTDFGRRGVGVAVERSFTIRNDGLQELLFTGTPRVELVGPNASDFVVLAQPPVGALQPGGTVSFTVRFTPSALGLRQASIAIDNSDGSAFIPFVPRPEDGQDALGGSIAQYLFSIQGSGAIFPLYLPVTVR